MTSFKKIALVLIGLLPGNFIRAADNGEDEKDVWEQLSGTRRYKDPGYAAKLSLNFFPVDNGHFYVGEVGKGIWYSVGETASLAAVVVPLLGAQSRSKRDRSPVMTDGMAIASVAGGVAYIALKVVSAYSAADGARRYNDKQEEIRRARKQAFRWNFDGRRLSLARTF